VYLAAVFTTQATT